MLTKVNESMNSWYVRSGTEPMSKRKANKKNRGPSTQLYYDFYKKNKQKLFQTHFLSNNPQMKNEFEVYNNKLYLKENQRNS